MVRMGYRFKKPAPIPVLPYSPNLSLIERFWKFLCKKVIRILFPPTFAGFRPAVQRALDNVAAFADELSTLMTENFHLFGANSKSILFSDQYKSGRS